MKIQGTIDFFKNNILSGWVQSDDPSITLKAIIDEKCIFQTQAELNRPDLEGDLSSAKGFIIDLSSYNLSVTLRNIKIIAENKHGEQYNLPFWKPVQLALEVKELPKDSLSVFFNTLDLELNFITSLFSKINIYNKLKILYKNQDIQAQGTLYYNIFQFDTKGIKGWAINIEQKDPVKLTLEINKIEVAQLIANDYSTDNMYSGCSFFLDFEHCSYSFLDVLPASAEVILKDKKTNCILAKTIMEGHASKEQQGLCTSDGVKLVFNKGVLIRPWSSWTKENKNYILYELKNFLDFTKSIGYDITITYGTLLGAIRDGTFIEYDDDIDLMFISSQSSPVQALKEFFNFFDLMESKYNIKYKIITNGQYHIIYNNIIFDIFLSWFENDRLNIVFAVLQGPKKEDIYPLTKVLLDGVHLTAPNKSEILLKAIYGPEWINPDPSFKYIRPKNVIDFFSSIDVGEKEREENLSYWNSYYYKEDAIFNQNSAFSESIINKCGQNTLLIDIGCGDGRDSFFFSKHFRGVRAYDYSDIIISKNKKRALCKNISNISFVHFNIYNMKNIIDEIKIINALRNNISLCIYSRFFLHAIKEQAENNLLFMIKELLIKQQDLAVLEFRTENDIGRKKVTGEHYRRAINPLIFIDKSKNKYNLDCISHIEGTGYAVYKDDDAYVARIELRKSSIS